MEREFNFNFGSEDDSEKDDSKKKEKKAGEKKPSFIDDLVEKRKSRESNEDKSGKKGLLDSKEKDDDKTEVEPTKKELAKEYLAHKAEELHSELESPTSIEHATETQADLDLIDAIVEKIDDPDKEVGPAVEEAYNELMEAIEADTEAEIEDGRPETEESEDAVIPDTDPESNQSAGTTPMPSPTSGRSSGSGGSSSTPPPAGPPTPPTPPPGRPPVPPIPPVGAVPAPPTPNFNAMPTSSSPESTDDDRRRVAGKMLVAGAVGYMIGRRGGRKRTEAKLGPVIKEHESSIKNLEKDVEGKELQIRQAAKEGYATEKPPVQSSEAMPTPTLERPKDDSEKTQIEDRRSETEKALNQPEKPQADKLRTVQETQTHLKEDVSTEAFAKAEKKIQPRIEQVSTPDLLRIAEKITILNTTIRKLYETNQIDRRGLEEIVKEHLKGHDIGPVLDKRLLGKEAILDRSHEYRHDPTKDDSIPYDSTELDEVEKLTKQVAKNPSTKPELHKPTPLSTPPKTTAISRNSLEKEVTAKTKDSKNTAVTTTVIIAVILAVLLVALIYT
jgi:predicted RNase H-like HicB family nuclease